MMSDVIPPPEVFWSRVLEVETFSIREGRGPQFILFPGLGCSSFYFKRLREELKTDFTVWSFDPAGLGYSRAPKGKFTRIRELTDHFAHWLVFHNLHKIPMFGHSLGAEILIDLAARYPELVSKLILCAPSGIPECPSISRQFIDMLRNLTRERPIFLLRAFKSYLYTGFSRTYALAQDQKKHHTGLRLPLVRVPTLVLVGDRDPVTPPGLSLALATGIPHAESKIIVGGAHALHDSHAVEVAEEIRRFVAVKA